MQPQPADPIYEVKNREKGIIALEPEFYSESYHDHPNCPFRESLLREGNFAWGRNEGYRCTNCEKLWQQGVSSF